MFKLPQNLQLALAQSETQMKSESPAPNVGEPTNKIFDFSHNELQFENASEVLDQNLFDKGANS